LFGASLPPGGARAYWTDGRSPVVVFVSRSGEVKEFPSVRITRSSGALTTCSKKGM